MRLLTVTILILAVLVTTAHAADPPSPKEVFAQVTSDSIRLKEEALAAEGDRVATAIRHFTRSDAASQDATFEEMQKHLSLLRPMAEEALKGYGDFRTALVNLRKELVDSPRAYQLAAAAYRQKAPTYETAELRRSYRSHLNTSRYERKCNHSVPLSGLRARNRRTGAERVVPAGESIVLLQGQASHVLRGNLLTLPVRLLVQLRADAQPRLGRRPADVAQHKRQ